MPPARARYVRVRNHTQPLGAEIFMVMAAIFNLNHPVHVVNWHFIHLTLSNVIVIAVMLIVFAIAIALPFPGAAARQAARTQGGRS